MNGQGVGQILSQTVLLFSAVFTVLLYGLLTSGLMVLPALTLGPIVEGLAH